MATAVPASSSSWWPRTSSSSRESPGSSYRPDPTLYTGGIPSITRRPKTATPQGRPNLMTSVTNPKPSSSSAFTSSSKPSKFNLASVISFASRSKKQPQPVDIQDPPEQVRSLPVPKPSSSISQFRASSTSAASNPRLSRGVASSTSGTSRASTDGPLTPADESGSRISYQHSLMTLTDLSDPFASDPIFKDHRASVHSDKSAKRLVHKMESKTAKTTARLPVGEGPKRPNSRDRSATLPSRVKSATDAMDTYLPLRAVEPPWASSGPRSPTLSASAASPTEPRMRLHDGAMTVRGTSSTAGMIRKSKSAKPTVPLPDARPHTATGQPTLQAHQRSGSSSSLSKENFPGGSREAQRPSSTHGQSNVRASATSSTRTSISSLFTSPLSFNSRPNSAADLPPPPSLPDAYYVQTTIKAPSTSSQTTPTISTQFPRTGPRPPPTHELPPTPGPSHASTPSSPSHLHPSSEHPLRARSGTVASSSAVSFASSLSSLSFNSRPSPQDPPSAYGYPSILAESFPIPGAADEIERRGSNSGSSLVSEAETRVANGHEATSKRSPTIKQSNVTPKQSKSLLSGSRSLPSPPVPTSAPPSAAVSHYTRERATSATSSTFSLGLEGGKTLRKQRSFHNTSPQAPAPQPKLRHYNSFEPPMLRSPPLPPPRDLPPLPPPSTPSTSTSKRGSGSTGKETLASPRRRLFSSHKHDKKQELESSASNNPGDGQHQTLHHSSSWFDEASAEPAPPSVGHDVAQHIVPPAELLRLGAVWERENENNYGARMAKESWSSRDSDTSRTSSSSRPYMPPRSAGADMRSGDSFSSISQSSTSSSKLPRSTSMLSKASSAPTFARVRGAADLPFTPTGSPVPPESYTSLSPPPRRQHRTIARPPTANSAQPTLPLSPPPRRALSNAAVPSGATPARKVLIERKPSFLDMSTRRSVSIDLPDPSDNDEPGRDSFLELSRGMDSIDTIRESEASFMQ